MAALLKLFEYIPKPIAQAVALILLGVFAFAGTETRYMTVSDFTKSYILDLKSELRSLRKDIADDEIAADIKEHLREQFEALLDELCYETPTDSYCKNRE